MSSERKIFDIIPPTLPLIQKPEKPVSSALKPKPKSKVGLRLKKIIWILLLSVVLIAVFTFIFIKPLAVIEIWPTQESKYFETSQLFPGEVLMAEKVVSQDFSSTGRELKETKARGTITVYNAYSTLSQTLLATTRFVSADGKLFRTPKRVIIPGGHYEEGKLIPGSVDIEVVADQPGPDYNIGPTAFSIPGFAGTAKYTTFYAKSSEPMTGGEKKEVSVVTREDLDRAKDILTKKALKESSQLLADSIASQQYILVEGASTQKIVEIPSLVKAGEESDTFSYQVKAESKASVFKKMDLEEFVLNYIQSQIPKDKAIFRNSLNIQYSPETINLEKGLLTLNLKISLNIYPTIEEASLKALIKDKKTDEIIKIFQNLPGVAKIKVSLSPFWATRAPQDINRIKINLKLD